MIQWMFFPEQLITCTHVGLVRNGVHVQCDARASRMSACGIIHGRRTPFGIRSHSEDAKAWAAEIGHVGIMQ